MHRSREKLKDFFKRPGLHRACSGVPVAPRARGRLPEACVLPGRENAPLPLGKPQDLLWELHRATNNKNLKKGYELIQ